MEENNNQNFTGQNLNQSVQPVSPTEKTENLSSAERKAIEKERIRAEKKEYKERRKIKKAKKALRCRRGKNFGWAMLGFFLGIIILFSGIFIGVKLIPLKTFLGDKTSEYVDEEKVGNKSLIDAIVGYSNYTMEEVPFVSNLLLNILSSSGIDSIITLDEEKLKELKFDSSFADGLLESVKVSKDLFGSLSELELFQNVSVADPDNTESDFLPDRVRLYYYEKEEDGLIVWARAYDDAGERLAPEGEQIYIRALQDLTFSDMQDLFSVRFQMLSVVSVLKTVGDVPENSLISEILGERTIKDMATFDQGDILLSKVIALPSENPDNQEIYDVILDAVAYDDDTQTYDSTKTYETLTVADLSAIDMNGVRLCNVIDLPSVNPANTTLYNILLDAVAYDSSTKTYDSSVTYDTLRISDLSGFDMDGVRLSRVIDLPSVNPANATLYNVLVDAAAYDSSTKTYDSTVTAETLTLADLSTIDINGVRLTRVVEDNSDNATLYNVLKDAISYDASTETYDTGITNSSISFGDLSDIDISGVHLSSVIRSSDVSGNAVLTILYNDPDVRFANLGEKIDNIKVSDLYDIECFVTDSSKTNDVSARYVYDANTKTYTVNTKDLML
ncbi:MAG: hypothetical protein SPL13_00895 [Clostridia bacterium]|nr:hypothetical protein [Clostridia bacterium]